MGKEYATGDSGRRVLLWIVCDKCGAKMRPGQHVIESGWTYTASDNGPGTEKHRADYCEDCS